MRKERTTGRAARAAAFLLLLLIVPAGPGEAGTGAFQPGEKLTFSIQYGVIKAGTAEVEVSTPGGDGSWMLTSRARTNSFFDVFFKVRDRIDSWIDPETFESIRFEKRLREGKYKGDETVRFDRERRVAVYGDSTEVILPPGTRDVFASFFWLRNRKLPIGEEVSLTYHSSKKNWPTQVKVGPVEKVKVPAGEFLCIRIEPRLQSVGVFKQTGRLRIWVTADKRRIPVKLESKVTFGAFQAVLTDYSYQILPE